MNILGIITARGGSKGVPRKNLVKLAGRPLLAYTAEAARRSKRLNRTVLSTDDREIAEVGARLGLSVPFLRPAELAADSTPTVPVLQHAVNFLESSGEQIHAICLLQPTNPLRTCDVIDRCIDLFECSGADSVVTMLPVPAEYNPHWVYRETGDGALALYTGESDPIPRRQELPLAYHREGSVYVMKRDVLMKSNSLFGKRLVGHLMKEDECVNIDTHDDLARAERMLAARVDRAAC